ncbi:AtpZ/AtpI family protein [Flexibacterium corallicola]|uniref:AtpZ/AtpI family protein n=1 Tax=Flexibacterium corallicola TaxID=3037259 RepID=UPI00286F5E56|nr:AtpZ/AtpI family protein [Pseudovibrio sp. M1P-2-3]
MPDDKKQVTNREVSSDRHLSERLEKLSQTLDELDAPPTSGKKGVSTGTVTGLSQAWKMSSEFVAGVLVGAAMGWMFDSWLGTKPWGLIIFLLLGFAAGVVNLLRSAGRMAEPERRLNTRTKRD